MSEQAIGERAPGRGGTRERGVAAFAAAGVAAATIAVCSWVSLPFFPVPLTLQTLGVLVVGGVLGFLWGPVAVLVYLGLGLVGLPVFHNGAAGSGVLAGPTGGYLVGFLPAAAIMGLAGYAAGRRRMAGRGSTVILALGALVATAVIYAVGVPWLAAAAHLSASRALAVGLVPFLPGDLVKAGLAVVVVRAVSAALGQQGRPRFRGGSIPS